MNVKPLFLIAAMALFVGCNGPASDTKADAESAHAHDHPSEGPHGGQLIELGDEEYHAELIHDDDAETVTIYLLDGAAKKEVAIAEKELTLNMTHDGHADQFKLAAEPDASGKASKFVSSDAHLVEGLDDGAEGQLVVSIGGTNYSGHVAHDHDHDHDDHDDDDHDDDDHDHDDDDDDDHDDDDHDHDDH